MRMKLKFEQTLWIVQSSMLLGSMPRSIVPLAIFTSTSQAKLKNANLMKRLLLWQKGGEHVSQIEGTPLGVVCWSNAIFSGKSQPSFTGCDADLDSLRKCSTGEAKGARDGDVDPLHPGQQYLGKTGTMCS